MIMLVFLDKKKILQIGHSLAKSVNTLIMN